MDIRTLNQTLNHQSASSAAKSFGVSRSTIYRWRKRQAIRRRVYGCPDHQLLRRMESSGVLQKHIARYFGVSRWTIRNWCQRFGIAHHTTGQFRSSMNRNTPEIHEETPFGIGVLFGDDVD